MKQKERVGCIGAAYPLCIKCADCASLIVHRGVWNDDFEERRSVGLLDVVEVEVASA